VTGAPHSTSKESITVPKISDQPLTRVLIRFWTSDYRAIQEMSSTELSAAQIIRDALHQFVLVAKLRARKKIDEIDQEVKIDREIKEDFDWGALQALRESGDGEY
jgi:hypothetical protein